MKVIFLDIDGVLNCRTTKTSVCGCMGIDERLLRNLWRIVGKTNAEIVLISTWRERWFRNDYEKHFQDEFADHLDAALARYDLRIFDKTSDNGCDRGQGILNWCVERYVESFVVLDDQPFDYDRPELRDHIVKTDPDRGLTSEQADKAIRLLNKQDKVDPAVKFYENAVRLVKEKGEISTVILQRELRIGYGTALRILERMEAEGLIKKDLRGRYIVL